MKCEGIDCCRKVEKDRNETAEVAVCPYDEDLGIKPPRQCDCCDRCRRSCQREV